MALTNESLVNAGGMVEVGNRTLMVRKLSQAREIGLGRELARLTKIAFGPGGFFANAAEALDWLKSTNRDREWSVAVRELTALQGAKATAAGDAVDEFRTTPKGVAVELFWRTRQDQPTVTLQEIEAVVTEINALEVFLQIQEAITDGGKAPTPAA